jgi:GxxExxY protein
MLKQEGYNLIGAAIEVYHEMKGGLLEEIYQQCLEEELKLRGIPFESKKGLNVYYKLKKLDKIYVPDLYVYDGIMVELKAVKELADEHRAQLLNYMRLTNTIVGYLLNFGNTHELKWERFMI